MRTYETDFTTPLHVAMIENHRKAVLFLIAYGADVYMEFKTYIIIYSQLEVCYTDHTIH